MAVISIEVLRSQGIVLAGVGFRSGVGRQYIGEIGKTDNGIVVVTTHLYDGRKSLPLDVELYQHKSSLPEGNNDSSMGSRDLRATQLG